MQYERFEIGDYVQLEPKETIRTSWYHTDIMKVVGYVSNTSKYDVYVNYIIVMKKDCRYMFNSDGVKEGRLVKFGKKLTVLGDDGNFYNIEKKKLVAQCIRSDYLKLAKEFIRNKKIDKLLNKE